MTIDDLALASGFSEKDLARYRPMLERMVALALAQKDMAKPTEDDAGWIPWAGRECQIPDAKAGEYELQFRDSLNEALIKKACSNHDADVWTWIHNNSMTDITAYRLIKR